MKPLLICQFYGTDKEWAFVQGGLIDGTEETVIPIHAMFAQDTCELLIEWPWYKGVIKGVYSNEDLPEL